VSERVILVLEPKGVVEFDVPLEGEGSGSAALTMMLRSSGEATGRRWGKNSRVKKLSHDVNRPAGLVMSTPKLSAESTM